MKINVKKIIVPLLIVLAIIATYFIVRKPPQSATNSTPESSETVSINLPDNWHQIDNSDGVVLKYEKTVDSGLKPQIAVTQSDLPPETTFQKYTATLVAGAKSTLPALRYSHDDLQLNARFMVGTYRNSGQTISLIQRAYLRGQTIYTLTGSFDNKSATPEEINSILDSIVSQHLPS